MLSYFMTYGQRIARLQEQLDDIHEEITREVDMLGERITDLMVHKKQLSMVKLKGDDNA